MYARHATRSTEASPEPAMIARSLSLALALCAAAALPAAAASQGLAQISAVKGDVRLASGGAMQSAASGAALKAGDRVVARSGSARIAYADGCIVTAPAGTMVTVGKASPCAGGPGLVTPGDAAALSIPGISKWDANAYVAAAGVLVLGASLIAGITHKDKPESP
jgi:hypothetical protein